MARQYPTPCPEATRAADSPGSFHIVIPFTELFHPLSDYVHLVILVVAGAHVNAIPPISNPTPCTLHPAPCTLHPAPCTLHPGL